MEIKSQLFEIMQFGFCILFFSFYAYQFCWYLIFSKKWQNTWFSHAVTFLKVLASRLIPFFLLLPLPPPPLPHSLAPTHSPLPKQYLLPVLPQDPFYIYLSPISHYTQIAQTTAALTRLKPVRNERSISLSSKTCLMLSLVTSIFLHACELWTLTAQLQRRMPAKEMRC